MFKDKDGNKQEVTEFHNISAFSKLGELAGQYLKKGQQVLVEGRIQTRSWETNGEKKSRTEIVADNIQFGAKGSGTSSPNKTPAKGGESDKETAAEVAEGGGEKIDYPSEEINPDDIPF
jgi:single-strand DNA-binding protein